jgi:regulator of protease activity HflC (stomatin/prohibitin superfamily)
VANGNGRNNPSGLSTLLILFTIAVALFQIPGIREWLGKFLGGVSLSNELIPVLVVIVILAYFFTSAVKIVREYERVVVFRLGRLQGAKGPGLFFIIPVVDKIVKVGLRTVTLDVPPQEVVTRDNVTVSVNAIIFFRVVKPEDAIVQVEDFYQATSQIAQTTLRSVLGQVQLDDLLAEREKLNKQLQAIIDENTDPWGVKVRAVEIKDVRIPQEMQRAIARQAEAERERRSKIINAEGELQAAEKLREAASILQMNPAALQLRYLQTLIDISSERNTSTIVFPLPIEIMNALVPRDSKKA